MIYFVDFETQGLEGKVVDCAFVSDGIRIWREIAQNTNK